MKNWHFYIQSVMVLLAIGAAVQIPSEDSMVFIVIMIQFILGCYQLMLSGLLMRNLARKTILLKIHFNSAVAYIFFLLIIGVAQFEWVESLWVELLFVFPWLWVVFFLVAMDDLERLRNYRL